MNLFLSSVMFSVKKVSFPAKTAVLDFTNLRIKTNVSLMIILTPKIILNNHIIKHSIDKYNRKKIEMH